MSIVIENLSYVYMKGSPFERIALEDINLKIESGEFVGIIGHTGSGKSTLVQHLNGLLKPTSGKVIIDGIDTTDKNLKELRKKVGLIFQYPEHQLFEETVRKDIAFGLVKQGVDEETINRRINEVIKIVDIDEDILDKSPFELSGGQKRRVAIAGVAILNPGILILDEPTAGLDPKGRDEVFELIRNMHKQLGNTIILVSHSMEDMAKLANRIIVMNKGKIHMDGKPREVYQQTEKLEEVGLSAPQVTYLMKKLKEAFPQISDNVFTVADAKKEILKYLRSK